jgi:hypothetical protein
MGGVSGVVAALSTAAGRAGATGASGNSWPNNSDEAVRRVVSMLVG